MTQPPSRLRAVLADDEPLLLDSLRRQLAEAWPELDVVATATGGGQALAALREHRPEVAFLDIRMPGLSGIEVAQAFGEDDFSTQIVFVTAFDRYAVAAFERGAVDYLLKPVTRERLDATVERLRARLGRPADLQAAVRRALLELAKEAGEPLRWLRVQRQDEVRLIPVEEVICLRSGDKYTSVLFAASANSEGKEPGHGLLRTPLVQLERQLDPSDFWRIHRGILINVRKLNSAVRKPGGRLAVRMNGLADALPVSAAYKHLFRP
jgi:DNA-binding LytR/AlgR family response regulator